MTLVFPESSEDLARAFNNALDAGSLQAARPDAADFWGRFELLAFDEEAGADVFLSMHSKTYLAVPREVSE